MQDTIVSVTFVTVLSTQYSVLTSNAGYGSKRNVRYSANSFVQYSVLTNNAGYNSKRNVRYSALCSVLSANQ